MTGLGGTGRLADDLWLLAHDDRTGKPHLQPRATGLGLAGALLAELTLSHSLRLRRGMVMAAEGVPPRDDVARSVLSMVAGEPEHLVGDWLLFLARTASTDVAGRLERARYLTRIRKGRFSRGERWVPVDPDCAFAPLVRVKSVLREPGPASAQDAALGGLAAACGLGHQLALYLPSNAIRRVEEAAQHLDPDLRELIALTRAAVDAALLSHRVSHPI